MVYYIKKIHNNTVSHLLAFELLTSKCKDEKMWANVELCNKQNSMLIYVKCN